MVQSIYHSVCIKIVYPFRIFYVVMDKNFNKIFYIYRDEKKKYLWTLQSVYQTHTIL